MAMVAFEAIRAEKTIAELLSQYEVTPGTNNNMTKAGVERIGGDISGGEGKNRKRKDEGV